MQQGGILSLHLKHINANMQWNSEVWILSLHLKHWGLIIENMQQSCNSVKFFRCIWNIEVLSTKICNSVEFFRCIWNIEVLSTKVCNSKVGILSPIICNSEVGIVLVHFKHWCLISETMEEWGLTKLKNTYHSEVLSTKIWNSEVLPKSKHLSRWGLIKENEKVWGLTKIKTLIKVRKI